MCGMSYSVRLMDVTGTVTSRVPLLQHWWRRSVHHIWYTACAGCPSGPAVPALRAQATVRTDRGALLGSQNGGVALEWYQLFFQSYILRRAAEIFQKSEHFVFAVFLTVVNILPLGMSILQMKEDIFADCRKKFWNTYKVRQAIYLPTKKKKKDKIFEIFLPPTAFLSLHCLVVCRKLEHQQSSAVRAGCSRHCCPMGGMIPFKDMQYLCAEHLALFEREPCSTILIKIVLYFILTSTHTQLFS